MAVSEAVWTVEQRIDYLKDRLKILPQICVERGRLVTESYADTEGQPPLIRKALALRNILSRMSIGIHPYELVVGNVTSALRGAPILPELCVDWLEAELDTFDQRDWDTYMVKDEIKEEIRDICRRWKGKTLRDKAFASMGEALRNRYLAYSSVCKNDGLLTGHMTAHVSVDYQKVLEQGLVAVKEEIRQAQSSMDRNSPGYLAKSQFYEASGISLDAVLEFAQRHSSLASSLADQETHPARKQELLNMAQVCRSVPAGPARTFHEAIQSLWFMHIALLLEGLGYAFTPGRLDQYLWPYYENDLKKGLLTRTRAKDLLKFLFVKMNEWTLLLSNNVAKYFSGFPLTQIITVGGTTPDGRDATNELSYLCLEADAGLGLPQPELVIKVHPGMPDDLLGAACGVAKRHVGKLKFISDEMAVRKLRNCGYSEAEARDYVLVGCHEPFVPRMTHYWPSGHLNVAKCLELALNDGKDRLMGQQLGPTTGDPRSFSSLSEILGALQVQVRYFVEHMVEANEAIFRTIAECAPTPLQSALIRGCIQRGTDATAKGADYNFTWQALVGLVNVGDSLAAIKKTVFDDGRVSMPELIDALDANFVDHDESQQLLRAAPKFGNDDDYVDLLAKDAINLCCEEVQNHRIWKDIFLQAAASSNTGNIPYGAAVGATPDGRFGRQPLGEGGVSPVQGRNTSGATATMKSVAKLDHATMKSGSVFNMRFDPAALKNDDSIKRLAALIRAYCLLGGFHVQFNVVDSKTLKEAQERPDQYRDLLVRVATYTSYFTELGRELQDNIIERVEFGDI